MISKASRWLAVLFFVPVLSSWAGSQSVTSIGGKTFGPGEGGWFRVNTNAAGAATSIDLKITYCKGEWSNGVCGKGYDDKYTPISLKELGSKSGWTVRPDNVPIPNFKQAKPYLRENTILLQMHSAKDDGTVVPFDPMRGGQIRFCYVTKVKEIEAGIPPTAVPAYACTWFSIEKGKTGNWFFKLWHNKSWVVTDYIYLVPTFQSFSIIGFSIDNMMTGVKEITPTRP